MALAGIKSRLMSVSCFSLIRQQLVGWFCIETATDGAVMLIMRDKLWNLEIMPVGNERSKGETSPIFVKLNSSPTHKFGRSIIVIIQLRRI